MGRLAVYKVLHKNDIVFYMRRKRMLGQRTFSGANAEQKEANARTELSPGANVVLFSNYSRSYNHSCLCSS